jgi:hypothetical protein
MTQRMEREGSLAFSLAELSKLEDERLSIAREREARLLAASLEAEREAARQRQAREAAEARVRAEALQREEERRREERVRLSAIAHAEIVRATTLAEAEASVRRASEEHRHAQALASLATLAGVRRWKRAALASWVTCGAVLAGCIGVELGVLRPEAQRRVAAAEAGLEMKSKELRAIHDEVEEEGRAVADLRGRAAEATLRSDALAKSLDAARAEIARLQTPRTSGHPPSGSATPSTHPGPFSSDCPPGSHDPLCGLPK